MTKCAIMSLTTRKPSVQVYTMGDQPIPRAQKHDHLGVTMSANLSWKNQCNKVCNKAKRTLGLVKCTLHAADISVRKTAYAMLVPPSMEYATCAWSPHTQKDAQRLETVQRAAARFVCGDYKKTYHQILNYAYKYVRGHLSPSLSQLFTLTQDYHERDTRQSTT